MDWHVPLLVVMAALAAFAVFALVRARLAQRMVEHRVAIIGAREAAFIGILQSLSRRASWRTSCSRPCTRSSASSRTASAPFS